MIPLNPKLYGVLESIFGDVQIANEGQRIQSSYVKDYRTGSMFLQIHEAGEYYRVNCPYCNDTRKRLWIHYQWGVQDERNRENRWLLICYNSGCFKNPETRMRLFHSVYDLLPRQRLDFTDLVQPVEYDSGVLREVLLPGVVVPLDQLDSSHPAVRYVYSREFDPVVLANCYGVGFCTKAVESMPQAEGRIIIPIYFENKLVGWQGRHVEAGYSRAANKYYTMPGLHKRKIFYNWDQSEHAPFAALVEGVTDVWRGGPGFLGLLGKSLSEIQIKLLHQRFRGKPVFHLLDPDAGTESTEISDRLSRRLASPVISVPLLGQDPGDTQMDVLWSLMAGAAVRQGVQVPWVFES